MRRLLAVLLFIAPLAHALSFRFDPPAPTNLTSVAVTVAGTWPSGCQPPQPKVIITESKITLDFVVSGGICPAIVLPFERTANLGVLPAGVYDLAVTQSSSNHQDTLATTKLVVRDATTFTMTPIAGPIAGGTKLRILSSEIFDVEPLHVSVDGTEVAYTRIDIFTIEITMPAHAAGPVDILVDSVMGGAHLAKAAFTYYDPNATTPDPFVFTSVLFPIDYNGSGALGAQWRTENVLQLEGGNRSILEITNSASGRVVALPRDQEFYANSRIRDLSRSASTTGTEIPVVRESGFRDRLRLLNVPTGNHLRALVRVWTTGETSDVFINIDQIPTLRAVTIPLTPTAGGLRYGTLDISGFLDPGNPFLDVSVGPNNPATRIWGMISVTNNDTGQVTIVSPQ